MGIQIIGNGGVIADVDGTTFRALKNTNRPMEFGANGHFQYSAVSGILPAALAAASVVFSFRWGDASKLAIVTGFRTRFLPLTLFTAATLTDHTSFDAFVGRSFSASHTGGTGATMTGNNQKKRTSMGTSLIATNGDIRIATTAALGGGTVTLDAQPFSQSIRKGNRANPAAGTEETIQPSADGLNFNSDVSIGEHPIVLAQNEGVVVRNRTVWPAAGTGQLLVEIIWAEVSAY
jgi:hypothetical protein